MSKKIIDLTLLVEESEKLKGTTNCRKYSMECSSKSENNNRWLFVGWYIPDCKNAELKKHKDAYYLMCENNYRYKITEEVNNLLNIY